MQSEYANRNVSEDTMGGNHTVKYYGLIMLDVVNKCRSSDFLKPCRMSNHPLQLEPDTQSRSDQCNAGGTPPIYAGP